MIRTMCQHWHGLVRGLGHRWPYALLIAMSASSLAAQSGPPTAALRGRVYDAVAGTPLAAVTVSFDGLDLRRFTDSAGGFVLQAPVGPYRVRLKRLSYRELTDTVTILDGDTTEHVYRLPHLPVALSEIVISGRTLTFPSFFEPAYKRAAGGRGAFFTREDIEQYNAKDFEALLNRVPGVRANERGVTFQRCQSGLEVTRSPNLKPKVQVWIDGYRVVTGRDTAAIWAALASVKPYMIQIMEVYPGVATIPAEFLSDACAVVVIWTKRDSP